MRLYCFCDGKGTIRAGAGAIKIGENEQGKDQVLVESKMEFIQMGAEQHIRMKNGEIKQHYPALDIYECQNCGNKIVREEFEENNQERIRQDHN